MATPASGRWPRRRSVSGIPTATSHQVGPEQDGFFTFYEREVLPRLAGRGRARAA